MIYNEDMIPLFDSLDELAQAMNQSACYQRYQAAEQALKKAKVQAEYQKLIDIKQRWEQIASYGSYAPEYKTLKKAFYQQKRKYACLPEVAHYQRCRHEWEELCYLVFSRLAHCVEPSIPVEGGGLHGRTCSGSCQQ